MTPSKFTLQLTDEPFAMFEIIETIALNGGGYGSKTHSHHESFGAALFAFRALTKHPIVLAMTAELADNMFTVW